MSENWLIVYIVGLFTVSAIRDIIWCRKYIFAQNLQKWN